LALRGASAQARVLVWRGAIVVLLAAAVGRLLPTHWTVGVMGSALARPLVALGRMQVTAPGARIDTSALPAGAAHVTLAELLLALYLSGVVVVLARIAAGELALGRLVRLAAPLRDDDAVSLTEEIQRTLN